MQQGPSKRRKIVTELASQKPMGMSGGVVRVSQGLKPVLYLWPITKDTALAARRPIEEGEETNANTTKGPKRTKAGT